MLSIRVNLGSERDVGGSEHSLRGRGTTLKARAAKKKTPSFTLLPEQQVASQLRILGWQLFLSEFQRHGSMFPWLPQLLLRTLCCSPS